MNNRISVPAIGNIEFVDLQTSDINPLMTKSKVKVFYIGQNRNGSYIDKKTATSMSKTLRGCPIVGHYVKEKEDFGDHGEQMIIDGNGVTFNKLTKPYGFVAPDAKVWFQFFEDEDEFGNTCLREYLVTECFLWTGQFPEAQTALDNQDPQSMELDEKTLKGHWATDNNSGLEFFIINDAIFSTLCILGEDVEPCFEGAQFFDSEINSKFTFDDSFLKEYTSMIREFNYALKNNEGGLSMVDNRTPVTEQEEVKTPTEENFVENSLNEQDKNSETISAENENTVEEFKKNEEEEEKDNKSDDSSEDKSSDSKEEEEKDNDTNDNKDDEDEEKKPKTKNSLEEVEVLQNTLNELQSKFELLEKENKELLEFKQNIENEKKDELINSFYMLSDEDKKDVIANKANYSLDDIEKELSVICVRKRVNFNEENSSDKEVTTVFNLNESQVDTTPAWLKAVEDLRNSK